MSYEARRLEFEEFWKQNEGRLRDIAKFEGYKGLAYEAWSMAKKVPVRIEKDPYGVWWIKWAGHAEGKYESAEAATEVALRGGARITYTGPELPE